MLSVLYCATTVLLLVLNKDGGPGGSPLSIHGIIGIILLFGNNVVACFNLLLIIYILYKAKDCKNVLLNCILLSFNVLLSLCYFMFVNNS
jgi:hypothetical protein